MTTRDDYQMHKKISLKMLLASMVTSPKARIPVKSSEAVSLFGNFFTTKPIEDLRF